MTNDIFKNMKFIFRISTTKVYRLMNHTYTYLMILPYIVCESKLPVNKDCSLRQLRTYKNGIKIEMFVINFQEEKKSKIE